MMPDTEAISLARATPAGSCCRVPDVDLLPDRALQDSAQALKALGHPIRLQMMHILSRVKGRLCVCEIEAAFDVKQPTVSHHLRILREAGLVDAEQRGLYQYYRIRPEGVRAVVSQLHGLV